MEKRGSSEKRAEISHRTRLPSPSYYPEQSAPSVVGILPGGSQWDPRSGLSMWELCSLIDGKIADSWGGPRLLGWRFVV